MLIEEATALQRADAVYTCLDDFKTFASAGRQEEAGRALSMALALSSAGLPELVGIFAAQAQTAQGLNLSKRPMRVLCAIGVTQPQSDAANAQANLTEQPAPTIA